MASKLGSNPLDWVVLALAAPFIGVALVARALGRRLRKGGR
jgi:hypothetical protein